MPSHPFRSELFDKEIYVIGTFDLATDFSSNGTLIMSQRNYAYYFRGYTPSASPLEDVEVGLVRVTNPDDSNLVLQVQQALKDVLPCDVRVFTRQEYQEKEGEFWRKSTPVGFIFSLGLLVGFVVGVIICSQILSTDVGDHLAEYATLKAIGYTNGYLAGVVFKEALVLSLLGFVPGIVFSKVFYLLLSWLTGLPLNMTFPRIMIVLVCTVAMCIISGFLAIGKVWVADPAEVF